MAHDEPRSVASMLDELRACAVVARKVATDQDEVRLAHALEPAVAALEAARAGSDTGSPDLRRALAAANEDLLGYISTNNRSAAVLNGSLRSIATAIAAATAQSTNSAAPVTEDSEPAGQNEETHLLQAAQEYGYGARRSVRMTVGLYLGGAVLAGVAISVQWLLVFNQMSRPSAGDFLVQSLPFLCFVVLVALVLAQANRQRRHAEELRRLERQLRTLPGYLMPLPPNTRALLRGSMLPRLFPRLLEDNDPIRESEPFPSTDYLMASIDEEFMELLEPDSE